MGWNTYYGVGGVFDQSTIISVAETLLDRGLAARGLQAGIYTDAGSSGCEHLGVGSLGHYQHDPHAAALYRATAL